ncbi:hypothetical protein GEMRC1_006109 [Eukaryota sp. GEM-RC1]
MDCFVCFEAFDLSQRVPLLICSSGHTCCSTCSASLRNCPICRLKCTKERKVNFALQELIKASRDGELCPQIPSEQIVLGDKIAEGGFAFVYAAEWCDFPVAIKMVSLSEKGRLQLQREMSLLFNLTHPSILRVFGTTLINNSIGIVMEKASSTIPCPSSLSATTVRYAKELCQAVKFLHSKSIVHGDLKPCNILIVNDRIRIADFGTSRNIESTSIVPRTRAMTVRYAAPEQFDNKITPQSDIYSLGVVLYELFQNLEAFKGMNQYAVMGAKYGGKPLAFDRSLPASLSDVINQCLQSDPILRPKISEILTVLDCLNLPHYPQQPDQNESLEVKNQSQSDEIRLLLAKNMQMDKEIDDLKKGNIQLSQQYSKVINDLETKSQLETQSFIQTINQLHEEIESLKEQLLESRQVQSKTSNRISQKVSKMSVKPRIKSINGSVGSIPNSRSGRNSSATMSFSPQHKHCDIVISNSGKRISFSGSDDHRSILGDKPLMKGGVYKWKVRHLGSNGFSLGIGIVPLNNFRSFTYPGGMTNSKYIYNNSKGNLSGSFSKWNTNDVLELTVDTRNNTFSVKEINSGYINVSTNFDDVDDGYYPFSIFMTLLTLWKSLIDCCYLCNYCSGLQWCVEFIKIPIITECKREAIYV